MRKLYVLALILAIQSPLFARIEKQQSAKTPLSNLAFSAGTPVLQLDDARWSVINSGLFLDKSVANRLVFGVNYNPAMVITQPTTFELTFTLQLTDASNVVTITPPQTLKIAFDPNGKTWKTYTDYAVFVSTDKHYKVGLLLNSLTVNGVAANNSPLKTSLFVQLEHEIERFYTIPSSPIVPVKPVVAYDAATRELVVTAMSTTQPEAVDVEWTYIDDYSGNPLNPSLNLTSTPYNFKNNATRVSLTDDFAFISPLNAAAMPLTTYRIPFVFEQGYVIFRTRALSYAGTGFDEPVYSSWSLADIGVQITNISAFHYQQVMPPNVHEKNKNWQFSATFSEGGKSKNVVNYADGSSRLRQAVTKLSTDNFAIVGAGKV